MCIAEADNTIFTASSGTVEYPVLELDADLG